MLNTPPPTPCTLTWSLINCSGTSLPSSCNIGDIVSVQLTADSGYTFSSVTPTVTSADNISFTENGLLTFMPNSTSCEITVVAESDGLAVVKGDIIIMNLDGTDRHYRVLRKVDSSVVEVLGIFTAATTAFGSSNIYENSTLDTALNTTWYNTLTDTAKSAIVAKTFTQDSWSFTTITDPFFWGESGKFTLHLESSTYDNSITRKIYALSVQDIIDYLEATTSMEPDDTTLTDYDLRMLIDEGGDFYQERAWLRSATPRESSDTSDYSCGVVYESSYDEVEVGRRYVGADYCLARPALQIDLSKIEWTKK